VACKDSTCKTSAKQLNKAFNYINQAHADSLIKYVNKYGGQFDIINKYELRHFLAQVAKESQSPVNGNYFGLLQEDLFYSIDNLTTTFPSRFAGSNPEYNDTLYAGHPRKLANLVYGNDKDLGNTQRNDGWNFRGSGNMEVTGRKNFEQFTAYYDDHFDSDLDFTKQPGLLRTNYKIAAISAMWHWKENEADDAGTDGNIKQITDDVRNTTDSWKDRKKLYEKIKKYITNCL
jgi:putative chitinase